MWSFNSSLEKRVKVLEDRTELLIASHNGLNERLRSIEDASCSGCGAIIMALESARDIKGNYFCKRCINIEEIKV